MNLFELLLLAIGLSMDAFAVAVCAGLTMSKATLKKSLIIGLYFGCFQAIMPLIGYLAAGQFAESIIAYDHWIAFVLLCFIGGKMIWGSFKKEDCTERISPAERGGARSRPGKKQPRDVEVSLKPAQMLPLALATSIDALAVGISFAFLRVNIVLAAPFIGITTFILSAIGVKFGHICGRKYKATAELAGGMILLLIGGKILLEHLLLF